MPTPRKTDPESYEALEQDYARAEADAKQFRHALEAIAGMVVNSETNHAELSALCMAIARRAL